ncbi:S8 family peptidase [Allorhizocola rhizosphaerae]|uniref:S8 family peptidase n=1 Tax=Allorhizocola rhizosphaerae TaxID=1872709 RepID=UPI001FE39D2D|nr:S8 family serine peptidase [Allorhizocola rhizosphaerae]
MRKFLALVLVAAALTGVESAAVAAVAPTGPATGQRHVVTLLTGDVVTVVMRQSGCPLVSVKPAKPSGTQLRSCTPDGRMRVIPKEVVPLLGTVLDEALFDVTALIREGYDDARTKELPLIVRREAGARAGVSLSSIDSVAVRQPKASGPEFLKSLPRIKGATPLVRLDRKVRVATTQRLDPNLSQVGAPQAWADGYTGRGVTVAVVDTGADFGHPDLAGQVVERADFTVKDGDAVDRHGHGTHVAATIAGTGAASAGRRKGVAPDAKLAVAKVLGDDGSGTDSQVIAGMEWAAARAKVVNVSLGGWEESDGTDPLSQAVDALTAKHGTLFVVAAGNSGDDWITGPAAAKEALTVGAVDRDDRLAEFSSRGPVMNTRAAKPELVAPGVDIIAARAQGTAMGTVIDGHYTSASGTSMATPHAAGGAAILAQRHPQWTPQQLKSGLVGAVDPLAGDVYEHGSGRLDVARKPVSAQAIVHLGSDASEATLAYTEPIHRLSITAADRHGTPTPPGAVTLSGNTVRVDRSRLQPGLYSAIVTAKPQATTPVTFYVAPPMRELTLSANPVGPETYTFGAVVNLDDPAIFAESVYMPPGGEPLKLSVPHGRYSIMVSLWNFEPSIMALAGDPDIAITADTSLVFDGPSAKPLSATVEGVQTVANSKGLTYEQTARRGYGWSDFVFAWGEDARRDDSVRAIPVDGAGIGTFATFTSVSLVAAGDRPSPFLYDLIRDNGNRIPDDLAHRFDTAGLARIDQRFHLLDREDTYVWHKRYGFSPGGAFILENDTHNPPANRTDYVTPGFRYVDEAFYNAGVGYGAVTQEGRQSYPPGSRHTKTWARQPLRPDWYDNPAGSPSGCEPVPITRTRGNLRVQLVDLTDQHNRFDCLGDGDAWTLETKRKLTLHRNGVLVGEHDESFGDFPVSHSMATYKLTYDLEASALLPVSTRVRTAWTFRSKEGMPVRLVSVDYALALEADNRPTNGRATFTVRNAQQRVSSFALYTSLDDGKSWERVDVRREGRDAFSAHMPAPGGPYVSLRVVTDGFEQTIIRAYR